MIPASLYLALTDGRSRTNPEGLTPFEVKIYGLLHMHLRYDEYREVKASWLARLARTQRPNVFPVLKVLTRRGYLETTAGDRGRPNRYRLASHVPPCISSIPPHAA